VKITFSAFACYVKASVVEKGSLVRFGTISTTVLSFSPTQMKVAVPSNAGVGAMKISVVSGGSITISNTDFTIMN